MQSSKVLVEKFSFENIKGHKFDPAEMFNKSKGLKSKARSYIKEDGLMNYRFSISMNNFEDDDKDDDNAEPDARLSCLPSACSACRRCCSLPRRRSGS